MQFENSNFVQFYKRDSRTVKEDVLLQKLYYFFIYIYIFIYYLGAEFMYYIYIYIYI